MNKLLNTHYKTKKNSRYSSFEKDEYFKTYEAVVVVKRKEFSIKFMYFIYLGGFSYL